MTHLSKIRFLLIADNLNEIRYLLIKHHLFCFLGSDRNTVEALRWLARNRLRNRFEDRLVVKNLVILITTGELQNLLCFIITRPNIFRSGPPEDGSLVEIGKTIRDLGRFMVVAVGPEATSTEFKEIVSFPINENYFRVPDSHDLERIHRNLYVALCRDYCLKL